MGEWYICNDEEVSRKSRPARKKIRLLPELPEPNTSRDAYMLVYKKKVTTRPRAPPPHIMASVHSHNAEFAAALDERAKR